MLFRQLRYTIPRLINTRFRYMCHEIWPVSVTFMLLLGLATCRPSWTTLATKNICMNLVNDLLQNPVDVIEIPSMKKLYIAERDGKVQMLDISDAKYSTIVSPELVLDLSDKVFAEGDHMGILGIALHPRFHFNGAVFVMYSADTDDKEFHHRQLISRFSLVSQNGTEIDKFSESVVLEIYQSGPTGGQIWFGSEDHVLYVAVGDGSPSRRKRFDRASHNGKILRINVDVEVMRDGNVPYKIPEDNPFAHQPTNLLPEVFAYGLQNPWRCSEERREMKRGTAQTRIICIDVGPKFSDFNIIQRGGMYGFMDESFSPCHDLDSCRNTTKLKSEFKLPVCRYPGIAVGGMFYTQWNAYLFADHVWGSLHYLKPSHSGSAWLRGSVEVIDNATCGPAHRPLQRQTILNLHQISDKTLYMLTISRNQPPDEPNGYLYRISLPKPGQFTKSIRSENAGSNAHQVPLCVIVPAIITIFCISDLTVSRVHLKYRS